jgi:hypothetical protein
MYAMHTTLHALQTSLYALMTTSACKQRPFDTCKVPVARQSKRRSGKMINGWKSGADAAWRQASRLPGVTNATYRRAFMEWVLQNRPNLFLTLTLAPQHDFIKCHTQADKLMGSIMQCAYSHDWTKRPARTWPFALGFLEHPYTNPHFHILIRANPRVTKVIRNRSQDIWARLMTHDDVFIEPIWDANGVVRYCTKEQISLDHFASAWVWGGIGK